MSSRKWLLPLLLSLPLAAVVLFLGGCLPVGLGDPETSRIDARLAGAWEELRDGAPTGSLAVLLPFDSRAYVLRTLKIVRTANGIEVKAGEEGLYKTWLTTIEGRTFLTAQPLYMKEAFGDGRTPGFAVVRIAPSEDGTRLKGWPIRLDFPALEPLRKLPGHVSYEPPAAGEKALTEDEARALLRKVVTENAGKDDFYDAVVEYVRVTDGAVLKAVFEGM